MAKWLTLPVKCNACSYTTQVLEAMEDHQEKHRHQPATATTEDASDAE